MKIFGLTGFFGGRVGWATSCEKKLAIYTKSLLADMGQKKQDVDFRILPKVCESKS